MQTKIPSIAVVPTMSSMAQSSMALITSQQTFIHGSPAVAMSGTTQTSSAPPPPPPPAVSADALNVSSILNQKDSSWLQLEVCREYQRNTCSRSSTECKFAHPPPHIEVLEGRVTACYDSIKARCNRDKPPCKYFHPPQHLKDQLLVNGKNHLAIKNSLIQQVNINSQAAMISPQTPTLMPFGASFPSALCGFPIQLGYYGGAATNIPNMGGYPNNQNFGLRLVNEPTAVGLGISAPQLRVGPALIRPQQLYQQQVHHSGMANLYRTRGDRVEACRKFLRGLCNRPASECRFAHPVDGVSITEDGSVTICMDHEKGRCARDPCRYFHRPEHVRLPHISQQHLKPAAVATLPIPRGIVAPSIGDQQAAHYHNMASLGADVSGGGASSVVNGSLIA